MGSVQEREVIKEAKATAYVHNVGEVRPELVPINYCKKCNRNCSIVDDYCVKHTQKDEVEPLLWNPQ